MKERIYDMIARIMFYLWRLFFELYEKEARHVAQSTRSKGPKG
jgi:hypothetical protein